MTSHHKTHKSCNCAARLRSPVYLAFQTIENIQLTEGQLEPHQVLLKEYCLWAGAGDKSWKEATAVS